MESGLEKIQTLEDSMIKSKDIRTTEICRQAPVFTSPLSNIDNLREGENAHFEARLIPVDDPRLNVSAYDSNRYLYHQTCFKTNTCLPLRSNGSGTENH